jgi:hypothetical protein
MRRRRRRVLHVHKGERTLSKKSNAYIPVVYCCITFVHATKGIREPEEMLLGCLAGWLVGCSMLQHKRIWR